jgi:CelD/BcsL family acetyltransferase involved in cellulose biosynthesis
MRNLQDIGETGYRVIADKKAVPEATARFLKLFPEARHDKAQFMTDEMRVFFKKLVHSLAEIGIVRFGVLETAQQVIAMVLYFDYQGNIYLYNSAYDPDFKSSSVGILSKAYCIRDSIEKSRRRFDFLKGSEQYKHYLGGKEILLSGCRITLR